MSLSAGCCLVTCTSLCLTHLVQNVYILIPTTLESRTGKGWTYKDFNHPCEVDNYHIYDLLNSPHRQTACGCITSLLWLLKNEAECEANNFSVSSLGQLTGAHSRKFSSCKAELSTVKHPSAPRAIFHLQ